MRARSKKLKFWPAGTFVTIKRPGSPIKYNRLLFGGAYETDGRTMRRSYANECWACQNYTIGGYFDF